MGFVPKECGELVHEGGEAEARLVQCGREAGQLLLEVG